MSFLPPALVPNISGHVHRVQRKKGGVWYVKYRAPDPTSPSGRRQVDKALGPEWPHEGPPPPGYYDRRAAQAALDAILTDARRGHVEVMRTGVTFERLAREWLVWGEHERGWKHSTLVDRRSCLRRHLIPAFGHLRIEQLTTPRIERWKSEFLIRTGQRRQAAKLVALLHSMYERAGVLYGLQRNPVAAVTRIKVTYDAARFDFYSPEEVWALVRAASSEQDAAIFLTAAFAGLRRGEIVALRWRDVDFAKRALRVETSVVHGRVDSTKGGRGRAVPMVREVAEALARLGNRGYLIDRDDPVFPGEGDWLDGSALRRRFVAACERAELRVLRFHDLRHTFGSNAINRANLVQVQAWMGHADHRTTMRYLHHKSLDAEADLLAGAFAVNQAGEAEQLLLTAIDDDDGHHSSSGDQE
jgi:integrase